MAVVQRYLNQIKLYPNIKEKKGESVLKQDSTKYDAHQCIIVFIFFDTRNY